ncbi:ABC transporter substrate-binding protein [Halovivax sp.]|uniref:ABC transporter substrate-binding protein n=1 Tax=Halovivax sp. TaxID=1935978 RepID=UPI0025BAA35F|nr:ABC transporter substrate-binding protein [Halovivax sp.]
MENKSNSNRIVSTDAIDRRRFLAATGAGAFATTVAGCLGGEEAGQEGPITIGHLGPVELSMGIGSERSGQLAIDQLNDEGGIDDREVEFVSADTRGEPAEAEREAEAMIMQEEVDVILGTFVSEVMQGIVDLVAEFDVPFLITGSADPRTLQDTVGEDYDHYKSVFRTGPINSDLQAEAMADYADYLNEEHGWESFAHIADDAAWTVPFSENLPDLLEDRGYDVVYEDRLSIETDDFTPVLDSIEAEGADAVFRFFAHIVGTDFLATWREAEYPFSVEGIHVASMAPEFWDMTEGLALYETTSQSGAGGATEITEETMPFVEAYQDAYADEGAPALPMYMGFNTYDAVYVYADAVERAGTTDYEGDLDAIVDALLETDHTGAAGEIELYGPDDEYPHDVMETRDEDDVISNFPMTQWQEGGEIECVYPREFATADHVAPDWV